jgi:DNA-directed RNA polymerase subunit F
MTTIDHCVDDSDIDVAMDDLADGERHALELANRIRQVALQDPEHAQRLVDELIVQLDRVMGGTFREHLDGVARQVAERALVAESDGRGTGISSQRNT